MNGNGITYEDVIMRKKTEVLFEDYKQQLSQLQQENQQLKEKLLKIFENIDISYNEWKKWKGELSKLNDSYSSEIQELLSIIGGEEVSNE